MNKDELKEDQAILEKVREEIARVIRQTWWEGACYQTGTAINLSEYRQGKSASILFILSDLCLPARKLTDKQIQTIFNGGYSSAQDLVDAQHAAFHSIKEVQEAIKSEEGK